MKIVLPSNRPQLSVRLSDDAQALMSPLGPDDRILLVEGLEELSIESRFNRFGHGRAALTASELEYLSDIDQRSHVAWGIAVDGEGAGVGRYIRLEDPTCAEIAVTVLDRFQQRGLGTLLFQALTAVARADGIEEFCFEISPDNEPVKRMTQGIDMRLDESGSELLGRVAVEDILVGPLEERFVEVMAEARGD